LRRYGGSDAIRVADIPDDEVVAEALDFQTWASKHKLAFQPAMIEEFALAFVRYYRQPPHVSTPDDKLIRRFNDAVDALKRLQDAASDSALRGDDFAKWIAHATSLLIERPQHARSRKIESRVNARGTELWGAFAKQYKRASNIGAPRGPMRRCAHALAQAWHQAFRELPKGPAERQAYFDLLTYILPESESPDRSTANRALRHAGAIPRLATRTRASWD
jgi:hypothetical protein